MQNIQESAACTCIQKIDSSQVALSRQVFFTIERLKLEPEPVFTRHNFEQALKKVSQKIKK